jgi:hypothetical protein
MSPDSLPDLQEIATMGSPPEWAAQIMMCDQMQTFLNRIDFDDGEILMMSKEELPSLGMIFEAL